MKISVIIPLYQKGSCIRETLDSVLAQTHKDFEVIIVDDGSTDEGPDIVRSYTDPRIKMISQNNSGVSVARNRGIEAATADWVAFIDADDYWYPTFLETVNAAAEKGGMIACFTNYHLTISKSAQISTKIVSQYVYDYFDFCVRNGETPMWTGAVFINRDALMCCGAFTPGVKVGQDLDTWGRLAMLGPFYYIASVQSVYHNDLDCNFSRIYHNVKPIYPHFVRSFYKMQNERGIPDNLIRSGMKYVNVLLLFYVWRLIGADYLEEARRILIHECNWRFVNPKKYCILFLRTFLGIENTLRRIRKRPLIQKSRLFDGPVLFNFK